MPLSKVKLPTDMVPLQLFEPRYRHMFRVLNQRRGRDRLFGVVQADRLLGTMESVGALCEMLTFVPVPEQRRIFVLARVVGRFRVHRVVSDVPVVTAVVSRLTDGGAEAAAEEALHAACEARVWQAMQDVRRLAVKMYGHMGDMGDDTFSLEVRRWCPDLSVLRNRDLSLLDPAMLDAMDNLGMLHRPPPPPLPPPLPPAASAGAAVETAESILLRGSSSAAPLGSEVEAAGRSHPPEAGRGPDFGTPAGPPRPGGDWLSGAVAEQLAADGRESVTDAVRRERFSFAALRSCTELAEEKLQGMMDCTSSLTRLQLVEASLLEGQQYLAARLALRDVF